MGWFGGRTTVATACAGTYIVGQSPRVWRHSPDFSVYMCEAVRRLYPERFSIMVTKIVIKHHKSCCTQPGRRRNFNHQSYLVAYSMALANHVDYWVLLSGMERGFAGIMFCGWVWNNWLYFETLLPGLLLDGTVAIYLRRVDSLVCFVLLLSSDVSVLARLYAHGPYSSW